MTALNLADISLDDKYTVEDGRIYVTGTQALIRLPMLQRQRDQAAGLNTATYISGYRGSPLGNLDSGLWRAKPFLESNHIRFQPGLNEDLAATAIWGTQQIALFEKPNYDGVVGIWYGKGPGVDRSGDPFKHANLAGTAPNGGVLALTGDDHAAKSSTVAHQSEFALVSAMMPVLNPASVQEYLDFGLLGIAMSRFSGCWVGFKCVTETVESTASVDIDPQRVQIVSPEGFKIPAGGLHIRWPDQAVEQEERLLKHKLPAAVAFARANRIDRVVMDAPRRRLGIVTTGKAYQDVMLALEELGIGRELAADLGLTVYKVGMTWPVEPEGVRRFAAGHDELLVIEEKRALIEDQLAKLLFHLGDAAPKRIVGKQDEEDRPLLPSAGELSPALVAKVIAERLLRFGPNQRVSDGLARIEALDRGRNTPSTALTRMPWFCSGCPHNTSTNVPEGSRSMAGIGCHTMAIYMPNRRTATYTHMGGEGATWIGQAPFCNTNHVFQNLGDGTYLHSGLLAIRAACAADVNITYKILFNDAVAMTGGQPFDGPLSPQLISQQVHAEGVKQIVVVSDEPEKYSKHGWAPDVEVRHRDDLDAVQRELREVEGVTVLIYDQTCAAEKRRRRKRGTFPDPAKRVVINEAVCEGCGDCGLVSNCVSIKPKETEFGRKREIDQSNCNKDFSCLKGFCPSFVSIHGGALKPKSAATKGGDVADPAADLPAPQPVELGDAYNILVTGIGGTGVVTIGALLGMAAHIEGKGVTVLDQTGLAQKNGAVVSHLRLAAAPDRLHGTRVPAGHADLVIGCDMVVAAGEGVLTATATGRTQAVVNDHLVPIAAFALMPDMPLDGAGLANLIGARLGSEAAHFVNATRLATALMGDSIAANLFLVGYGFQKGLIPLSEAAIRRAIELNGVAVEASLRAFAWGRLAAHDLAQVEAAAGAEPEETTPPSEPGLSEIVDRRAGYLTDYQNRAYADRYRTLVDRVAAAEAAVVPGSDALARTVAGAYFKLMAYKDEYEVARLHSSPAFMDQISAQFTGDYRLKLHLAPPLIARPDPATGIACKREFGAWVFPLLKLVARLKGLRGGPLDIFGRTEERRTERQLIADYETTIAEVLDGLTPDTHGQALEIAGIPERIRGFGHVKQRNLAEAKQAETKLLTAFRAPPSSASAAE